MNANCLHGLNLLTTCIFATILTLPFRSNAQCGTEVPTSIDCSTAPLLCLSNLCVTTTNNPFNCCNGFCGPNTAIHNPQYFAFVTTDEQVVFEIDVTSCSSGNGLQSAILGACPWDNADIIDCDPGTVPGGTMVLNASGLDIGNTYWLVIDGSSGATCEYIIRAISGVNTDFPVGNLVLDSVSISDTLFCPGMENVVIEVDSPAIDDLFYNWHTSWNSDTIVTLEPSLLLDIALDAPSGEWEICIWADNGCDTSNTICIPVTIDTFLTESLGVSSFCWEEFPFIWGDIIIAGPGTYTQSFHGAGGCRVDSTWIVLEYPVFEPGYIDTTVCAYQYIYEGEFYDASGVYDIFYPGSGANGCDSFAILDLTLQGFEFFVEIGEDENGAFLHPYITDQLGQFDTITYSWFTCDTTLLSTEKDYRPDSSGCYCVLIEAGVCSQFTCATYLVDSLNETCNLVASEECVGDQVAFSYDGDPSDVISYDWLIQVSQFGAVIHRTTSTVTRTFTSGTYHVSLTITDSTGTFTCHDSVHINPSFFAAIAQNEETLFASPDSASSYTWHVCGQSEVLSTSDFFNPDTSGCYCVDIEIGGCVESPCVNFVIVGIDPGSYQLTGIHPNPSHGTWQVTLSNTVALPVQWDLINLQGMVIESGELQQSISTIQLKKQLVGVFYLQLTNGEGLSSIHKVLLE